MKVLVFGSGGFVGRHVVEQLTPTYEVHGTSQSKPETERNHHVDLIDPVSVEYLVKRVSPDFIINCAGVVGPLGDFSDNIVFTRNILEASKSVETLKKIVICGSAAVYGNVRPDELPVSERQPTVPTSEYGNSKLKEEQTALEFERKYGLPVVVARIFNPLGAGMKPRFLTSRVMDQIKQVRCGERNTIELSRLDATRDYPGVEDVARGLQALLAKGVAGEVYNIGSGISTTNGELAKKMIKASKLGREVELVETSNKPEPEVASLADISKVKNDTGWIPSSTLDMVIEEIVHEE